ncbi:MAG: HNH endonuclease signature motif containing protein [Caldilineaceae bacterium]|nr:HNH endonuclease signature motif containing protein [Caldilineaceae bacterium]
MKFLVRIIIAAVLISTFLGGSLLAILHSLPIIVGVLITIYVLIALFGGEQRKATRRSGRRRKRKRAGTTKRSGYRHHLPDLIREQNGKCGICGRLLPVRRRDLVHVDHIRPIHLGGTHAKRNLRAVHAKCNLSRTKKDYQQSVSRIKR